jgi:hypothetical protein
MNLSPIAAYSALPVSRALPIRRPKRFRYGRADRGRSHPA